MTISRARACRTRVPGWAALLLLPMAVGAPAAGASAAGSPAAEEPPLDACDRRFTAEPTGYQSAVCFYVAGAATGEWHEALRRLRARETQHPDNVWLALSAAHVAWQLNDVEAARHGYQQAAGRFRRAGEPLGELMARQNLRNLLYHAGEAEAADAEVRRVVAIGRQSDDPDIVVRARVTAANHYMNTGQQIGRAYRSLRTAEHLLDENAEYALLSQVVGGLGNASMLLGEFSEAVRHFERLVALATEAGDRVGRALALFNVANATLEGLMELPEPTRRSEVVALADQALEAAVGAQSQHVQIYAHRLLGELHALQQPEVAARHLDRCVELAEAVDYLSECELYRARLLSQDDPREAARRLESVLTDLTALGDDPRLAYGWHLLMRAAWQQGPPERALEVGFQALDAIEALRRLQGDGAGRTGFLSAWTRDYYWLSGRLLERGDVERAFTVLERMRARELREQLTAFGDRAKTSTHPRQARRHREVLEGIVGVHRRLLREHEPRARERLLEELERLEIEERGLRPEADVTAAAPSATAGLPRVREALAGDEALVSFQLGNWRDLHDDFAGGAWLTVSTRDDTYVRRLSGRVPLARSVPLFIDLARRGDVPPAAAAGLYERIFGTVLDDLPDTVERLIIVPDGILHQMPFAALRAKPEALALGARFEIDLVPSATLWHAWRTGGPPRQAHRALVMAAPELEQAGPSDGEAVAQASWLVAPDGVFGALPFARLEGSEVHEAMGGAGHMLNGAEASEAYLKSADLTAFDLIHFASHAVVDPRDPDRSAILLAAGSDAEDGLLQAREISALRLNDTVVVLSSCQSATGAVVRGEGVMGLARAFFLAGADAVVGSLWPLRDDHARDFFGYFYAQAAHGVPVAEALRHARAEAQAAGLPTSVWAGVVLLGDGRPSVAGPRDTAYVAAPIVAGVAVGLAVALALWWYRARRRS